MRLFYRIQYFDNFSIFEGKYYFGNNMLYCNNFSISSDLHVRGQNKNKNNKYSIRK